MSRPGAAPGFGTVTLAEALDSALVALRAAGVDAPRLDAELLVATAAGIERSALLTGGGRPLPPRAIPILRDWVRRRAIDREPLAYVLGRRGFRHLELAVDPRVLIPRPETETLVELAVAELPPRARVLDVGTGSGAVGLALAHERPDLEVLASDSSAGAVALARENADRLGLDVAVVHGDLLDAVTGRIDAAVSNPPYVAEADRARLAPEISRHEPVAALFAGADGLAVIRRLIDQAAVRAVPWLALEVGAGQADAVAGLLAGAGYAEVGAHPDLAGIPRVVAGRWSAR